MSDRFGGFRSDLSFGRLVRNRRIVIPASTELRSGIRDVALVASRALIVLDFDVVMGTAAHVLRVCNQQRLDLFGIAASCNPKK